MSQKPQENKHKPSYTHAIIRITAIENQDLKSAVSAAQKLGLLKIITQPKATPEIVWTIPIRDNALDRTGFAFVYTRCTITEGADGIEAALAASAKDTSAIQNTFLVSLK